MNKTKRVVFTSVAVTIATVGMLNIADSIYAGTPVSAEGLNMSATIKPSSTVEISANAVSLNVVPSANGTFKASTPVTVSAYTNSNYDCTITMETASTSLTSGGNSIATLDNTYTESTFVNDKWGFSTDATNYGPVALTNSVGTFSATTPNAASITFATKLTQATKPGTYSGEVTFATTCTPPKIYMQSISASTLATLMPNVGDETTLYDSRDEKSYTVAHLADGNYWMTQNLDHDIVTTTNFYTYANTDIGHGSTLNTSATWTASTATSTTSFSTSSTAPRSYDPGDLCWNGTIITNDDEYDNATFENTTTACGDNKHYHIGNHYNWNAAVAMNNSSSYPAPYYDRIDVDQSICPAGWRLPTQNADPYNPNHPDKSFSKLINQLGLTLSNFHNSPVYFTYAHDAGDNGGPAGSVMSYWTSAASIYEEEDGDNWIDQPVGGALWVDPYNEVVWDDWANYRESSGSIRCVAR